MNNHTNTATITRNQMLAEQVHYTRDETTTTWVFNVWEDGTFDAVQVVVLVSDSEKDYDALHVAGNVIDAGMLRPSHTEWALYSAICEARI